jgi:hypothetical protein
MATAEREKGKTPRALDVVCPRCLNPAEAVRLNLHNLDQCRCAGCGETFSPAEASARFAALAADWRRAADWMRLSPRPRGR